MTSEAKFDTITIMSEENPIPTDPSAEWVVVYTYRCEDGPDDPDGHDIDIPAVHKINKISKMPQNEHCKVHNREARFIGASRESPRVSGRQN